MLSAPAMRVLALATVCVSVVLLASCGRVSSEPPASTSPRSPQLRCATEANAELVRIPDVDDRTVVTSSCGDVSYKTHDGALWLRTADGKTTDLGDHASTGAFDVTGALLAFQRENRNVLREIATGHETEVAGESGALAFAYDGDRGESVPFTCGKDGVRILRAGAFEPPIAGTAGLACLEHARAGATIAATSVKANSGDTDLFFVDVVRGLVHRADVDFARGAGDGSTHREDLVYLSANGRVALHREVRLHPCGDTECDAPSGTSVLDTTSGALIQHATAGFAAATLGASAWPNLIDRAGALVRDGSSTTGIFSIDTNSARYAEHADARVIGVLDGGDVALARGRAGTEVAVVHAGDTNERWRLSLGTGNAVAVDMHGEERVFAVESAGCVRVTGSTSCNGAGTKLDLVVRTRTREVARLSGFTQITATPMLSDGTLLLYATRFVSEPPAEAPMDGLALERSWFTVSRDGALVKLGDVADDFSTERSVIELADGHLVVAKRTWDGKKNSGTLTIVNRDGTTARTEQGESFRLVDAQSADFTPRRAIAAIESDSAATASTRYALWHGVR